MNTFSSPDSRVTPQSGKGILGKQLEGYEGQGGKVKKIQAFGLKNDIISWTRKITSRSGAQ
jgi:hypothetical protein